MTKNCTVYNQKVFTAFKTERIFFFILHFVVSGVARGGGHAPRRAGLGGAMRFKQKYRPKYA